MKKFIVLLLAALMIVGVFVSCKEDPKPTFSFVGTWECSQDTELGTKVTTIEMKEDKTFTLKQFLEGDLLGSFSGTYATEDGNLIATLDAESSAEYAGTCSPTSPLYVFFKDTHIETSPDTALMGTMQTTTSIETIVSERIHPDFFDEYELDDTTLSIAVTYGNSFYSADFTPDVFGAGVSRIDYRYTEGINDDSGNFVASLEVEGHYDASIVGKDFDKAEHYYYIFCKATKDNVSEVTMTSIYEEIDLTHFKTSIDGGEEQTFTQK